jgi:hypothetical protein
VTKVTARLNGLSHTFPGDVDILLVGPAGQRMILMSDIGGGTDAVNAVLTFDDAAPPMGATVVTGTFSPANSGTGDLFPAPAPAAPFGATLSVFNGTNPNGAWRLFVVDDAGIDAGSIAGGWSLTITTAEPVCCISPCVLTCPADVVQANDAGQCGAIVNFNVGVDGSCGVVTSSPPSGSFFPVGTTMVTVTATKQDSTTTTCTFNVTVNDTEAPTITNESVSPSTLGPPNHRMVDVAVSYNTADNCTAPGAIIRSLSVASNEPVNGTGDGDAAPDWQVVNANLVRLRAERAGTGSGRIYTITIGCTDAAGNTATKNVTVAVPHNP